MTMSYDDFLQRGLEGRELWNTIRAKCTSHHDMLQEMRERQMQLSVYAKAPVGQKIGGVDAIQRALLGDIKFLETMAWRIYMFGSRSLFKKTPGNDGELRKRQRTDPEYWKRRALAGPKHADKWLKGKMRREWEVNHLRRYNY